MDTNKLLQSDYSNFSRESEGTFGNNNIPQEGRDTALDATSSASGTLGSSMINLVNTILGAGVLAMPSAIASLGLIPGLFAVLVFGWLSGLGLSLLDWSGWIASESLPSKNTTVYQDPENEDEIISLDNPSFASVGDMNGPRSEAAGLDSRKVSFNALSKMTYPHLASVFDMAIAIKCFGVSVSYLVIVGQLMPSVLAEFGATENGPLGWYLYREFWICLAMIIIIPFCFLRKLDSLKYTSMIALLGVAYLFVLVIWQFIALQSSDLSSSPIPRNPRSDFKFFDFRILRFMKSLPVFVFGFTCHQNLFAVHNELAKQTPFRMMKVVWSSIGIAAFVYLIVGSLGYVQFGRSVSSNLLSDFNQSGSYDLSITVGRLVFSILVLLSYPLQIHPCRVSLNKVYSSLLKNSAGNCANTAPGLCLLVFMPVRGIVRVFQYLFGPCRSFGRLRFSRLGQFQPLRSPIEILNRFDEQQSSDTQKLLSDNMDAVGHISQQSENQKQRLRQPFSRNSIDEVVPGGILSRVGPSSATASADIIGTEADTIRKPIMVTGNSLTGERKLSALNANLSQTSWKNSYEGEITTNEGTQNQTGTNINSLEPPNIVGNNAAESNNEESQQNCNYNSIVTEFPSLRFFWMTSVILCLSFLLALSVDDLGMVLGVVGATGSTAICYILPAIFFLKLSWRLEDSSGLEWYHRNIGIIRRLASMMLLLGAIIMPVCVSFQFVDV